MKITILTLSIFVVFLMACTNTVPIDNYVNSESDSALAYNSCMNQCNSCEQTCGDSFFYDAAEQVEDVTLCDNIKNQEIRAECKDNMNIILAITNSNPSLCERIQDPSLKIDCNINVVREEALKSNDPNLCNGLENSYINKCKVDVVFSLVLESKDTSLCEKLSGENRNFCLNELLVLE